MTTHEQNAKAFYGNPPTLVAGRSLFASLGTVLEMMDEVASLEAQENLTEKEAGRLRSLKKTLMFAENYGTPLRKIMADSYPVELMATSRNDNKKAAKAKKAKRARCGRNRK